jgi:NAD(P)-dependent dehydrogenase (short-subunit alcohol dehydrogenase family)
MLCLKCHVSLHTFWQSIEVVKNLDLKIKGLRVLITAGANGIGREIARAFVAEGAQVHVCDVDDRALAELKHTDPKITASHCDVSDREQVAKLFEAALKKLGGLDCLVNNAGIAGPTGRVEEILPEDWDRCLAIDITGQFNCTRLAVPHLRQSSNPSIVNLASAAGKLGFALRSPYAAAKWGVIGFTKSLATELGPDKIRCNAILPGLVEGQRIQNVLSAKAQQRGISLADATSHAFSGVSLKKFVPPIEIAQYIVFLSSPLASTVTGQAIAIDGDTQMLP